MIVRNKVGGNFTIIRNEVLSRTDMSLKAKGLYCFLMSKPNNWQTTVMGLVSVLQENKDAIMSGLKELEKFGFYRKIQHRDSKGYISYQDIIYDEAFGWVAGLPHTDNPHTDNPHTDNPLQIKTDKIKTDETKTEQTGDLPVLPSAKKAEGLAEKILAYYNKEFGRGIKSTTSFAKNLQFWLQYYSTADIHTAFLAAKDDPYWCDKITPEKLFRQKNPNGESVDRIGDLIGRHKATPELVTHITIGGQRDD